MQKRKLHNGIVTVSIIKLTEVYMLLINEQYYELGLQLLIMVEYVLDNFFD